MKYFLDITAGIYFLFGFVSGENIALFLGGLASILAAVNHFQQILERKQSKSKDDGSTS